MKHWKSARRKKYATAESRFTFGITASVEEVAEIRRHLTPFENSIVEIEWPKSNE